MAKQLDTASGVVVIGLGRFGKSLALELENDGVEVLGIDLDRHTVDMLAGCSYCVSSLWGGGVSGGGEPGSVAGGEFVVGASPEFEFADSGGPYAQVLCGGGEGEVLRVACGS